MEKKTKEKYLSPIFEEIQVKVEQGFAQTGVPGGAGGNLDESDGWDW